MSITQATGERSEVPVNGHSSSQNSEVDVLIVGAGPAGLMLATWLSRLKISTRIIDKRNTKVFTGQADGVQCRTVEVFQSFGFAHRLIEEGAHINEVVHWEPAPASASGEVHSGIVRKERLPDNEPRTSRHPHAVLTQGRIERFMLDAMKDFNGLEVERAVQPTALSVDPTLIKDTSAHAISVKLRHLTEEEATPTQVGEISNGLFRSNVFADDEADAQSAGSAQPGVEETVKAKFVVGCDGARSWVRKQMGLNLEGDSANTHWGVLDILAITDFPDIRLKCTIHSKDAGSILIVPRERDLVRLYVQMGHTEEGQRVDRSRFTPEAIMETAERIMAPYTLKAPFIEWWSIYDVAQRVCPKVTLDERVFIAGDAFHTHSPKAGQGMNVSMMDTYNLGWKLAHVLQGKANPDILKTYQAERLQTARELIDLDYKLSRMFSAKPSEDGTGVSMKKFEEFFKQLGRWASGTAAQYQPGLLVAPSKFEGASGLPLGKRFESHQVVSIADARPWHIGDRLVSDGRWRVVIFAGDLRDVSTRTRLEKVAAYLDSPQGPLRRYTAPQADLDSVIEVLTIMSNPRTSIEPNSFPDILWPAKGPYGCRAYDKLYADDDSWFSGHGQAYLHLGIDPKQGCIAIVRPDQFVSLTCPVEDFESIGTFFDSFMIPPKV